MSEKFSDPLYLAQVQYATLDNLAARRKILEFSIPRFDIHTDGIHILHLAGNESILEVGCGDGSVLLNLRKEQHHQGRLVGIDLSKGMFSKTDTLQKQLSIKPPIEFLEQSADVLPFLDNSFDCILSFFMVYHMPDIEKALTEWKRILKLKGKIIIATFSQEDKPKLKLLKKEILDLIGKKVPPQFSSRFNFERGKEMLPSFFTLVEEYIYESEIRLPYAQPYLDMFHSIRGFFDPNPTDQEWNHVLDKVRSVIEKEIKEKKYFTDKLKAGFFVCTK